MQKPSQLVVRPRILLADDHTMVTEGLRSLLMEKNQDVVGVVADGRALLEAARNLKPDVVILDISMPLMNGLDAAAKLKESLPNVKIVFLTMKDDPNLAAAVLSMGPVGYVLKHSAASELLTAITEVLRGRPYVTLRLKPENWAVREARAQQFSKDLTPRQREVLQLLAEGHPMKEVASILNVSEKTVMFHKYHIMRSFNVKNNAELVLLALKQGLISVRQDMDLRSLGDRWAKKWQCLKTVRATKPPRLQRRLEPGTWDQHVQNGGILRKPGSYLKRPRILLADDHSPMLERVQALLEADFEIVGNVYNGKDLVSEASRLQPDVVLMDISMPGLTGIEAAHELRQNGTKAKFVFLTVHERIEFVHACLAEGAVGYVVKSRIVSDLITALREALSGRRFISPPVSRQVTANGW